MIAPHHAPSFAEADRRLSLRSIAESHCSFLQFEYFAVNFRLVSVFD